MPDQRLAAYQGNMEGLMPAHKFQYTFDQRVSTQVVQVAQGDFAAQVRFTVGIATGATERALASDLNGKHGDASAQDSPPSGKHLARSQTRIGRGRKHRKV